jgi:hypothetical protein
MSERDVDGSVTVTRLFTRIPARQRFAPPHVWRWTESALALGVVRVHFVTRAGDSRTRDGEA